ncbi:MAG: hypothetical protein WB952_20265 [Terriglobales bacterium]
MSGDLTSDQHPAALPFDAPDKDFSSVHSKTAGSDSVPEGPAKPSSAAEVVSASTPPGKVDGTNGPAVGGGKRRSPSTRAERQEFFLPVSGFIWLYPEEVEVVNHPAFQRLGRVYQLGQAYVVYRGATHKRLEHALGAVHVVQRMIEAVGHNSEKKNKSPYPTSPLTKFEERFVRLGALVHDIGHIAAGHTVEDELSLIPRHDEDHRLDVVFGLEVSIDTKNSGKDVQAKEPTVATRTGWEWRDNKGRTLAELIDEFFAIYVPPSLAGKVTASQIVRMLIRKRPETGKDKYETIQTALEESSDIRLQISRDMIGNTICADILDYIHRDWYHVGKPKPFDERLLQYMEVRNLGNPTTLPSQDDRFVISLGRRPNLRTDAVSNILELLEWRYQLCESVLFHKTKLAAAAMLDRALYELWGDSGMDIERTLLPLSDEELMSTCRELARKRASSERSQQYKPGEVAERLLGALEKRQLFKPLSTRFFADLPADVAAEVKRVYAGANGDTKAAAASRNRVLRVLESDFGLTSGSLTMYCPRGVNAKIAEVQIAVGPEIKPFNRYEEEHNEHLAGGHLDAQLRRFRRLWRVHFFIDSSERERLAERVPLLQQAIEKLALGHVVDEETPGRVARSLAGVLIQIKDSPWAGAKLRDATSAAYRDAAASLGSYPMGCDSIRAYIEPTTKASS